MNSVVTGYVISGIAVIAILFIVWLLYIQPWYQDYMFNKNLERRIKEQFTELERALLTRAELMWRLKE